MKLPAKYILPLGFLFFFVAGIAAASSTTFLSQAQQYINGHCGKSKLSDQTALLCYLFNKSQEQDTSIANINATISPIPSQIGSLQASVSAMNNTINNIQTPTGKTLRVFDANNHELGIEVGNDGNGGTPRVYNLSVNKIFDIAYQEQLDGLSESSITIYANVWVPLYYQSSDCSGTPYLPVSRANTLFLPSYQVYQNPIGTFYTIPPSEQSVALNFQSHHNFLQRTGPTASMCSPDSPAASLSAYPLTPFTPPFPVPIAIPLQYKYQ